MPRHPKAISSLLAVRLLWVATFVVPLILAILLLGVKSAQAAPTLTPTVTLPAFEEELEAEDEGEFEEDECEAAEEEFEEGELSRAEAEEICDEEDEGDDRDADASGSHAPEECVLRSAHSHAVANRSRNELRLTLGYTTYEPVGATVEIREGAARIGSVHRHLGHSGVLRIVKNLGDERPSHRIVVRILIADAPPACLKFQAQQVPVAEVGSRHASHARHARASA